MANENEDLINKTITTINSLTTGGRLNPEQQEQFLTFVKDTSVMLSKARFKPMKQSVVTIDKLYIGEPVTSGADEDSDVSTSGNDSKPVADVIRLESFKVRSDWSISTETLQENIEGDAFEDTLMAMMGKRISTDMELLAVQGDKSIAGTTALAKLLKSGNGWGLLTEDSHIVDAAGSRISKEILAAAVRTMPDQYLQDPELMWIMSRPVATDWMELISNRATVAGDNALGGNTLNPFGYPVLVVPAIPSRLPVKIGSASPASVTAARFGPYKIVKDETDLLKLDINNGVAVEVELTPGVYTAVELIGEIKRQFTLAGVNGVAILDAVKLFDDGQGRLVIETKATGAAAEIDVQATSTAGDNAAPELGIAVAAVTGAASATATVNEGSFIWLANAKNFILGMQDETRVYSKFNQDKDRIETVLYNQVAHQVENLEAIVKIKNLRRG